MCDEYEYVFVVQIFVINQEKTNVSFFFKKKEEEINEYVYAILMHSV